ncbi:hypothetical protein Lepto7375DRAFT_0394 [Leptolyngbya sp. PCC 7375]|nr:hypothetical protein Lepto7375DRAFT_0394 [Leptolyngbya sp. PCC 7375]
MPLRTLDSGALPRTLKGAWQFSDRNGMSHETNGLARPFNSWPIYCGHNQQSHGEFSLEYGFHIRQHFQSVDRHL